MYRKDDGQISMNEFISPFGKLYSENRWVKLAAIIPWEEIDEKYAELFRQKVTGAPAKNSRIAFGAMYIKEKYKCSDEETVAAIQENPYLQYFLGLNEYQYKPLFSPSTMVYFRKRLTPEAIRSINEMIMQREAALHMNDNGKIKTGKETAADLGHSVNVKSDMNADMKSDMNANMNPNMKSDMKSHMKSNVNPDMNPCMNPDINPDMNSNMNPDMNPDMNPGINPDMKSDMTTDMNLDMNPGMNPNMKPDMNANINPAMNTENLQYIQETLSLDTSNRSDNQ